MSNNTIPGMELDDPTQAEQQSSPVECLGKTFENDAARRDYYLNILAEKLKEPGFRSIEGFPIGEDKDILNLSDPPYYTACPNPWIADFIAEWEVQKPEKPEDYQYHREPFAADVSEGKNDPIYNAHSYHTKVPHKAIMRYILHYTEPGDIVFDGFCGTGMTGVAAHLCGNRATIESLGYKVLPDDSILQEAKDENTGKSKWMPFSKLGSRQAILNDLSPAATFIASNFNSNIPISSFKKDVTEAINQTHDELAWVYETFHNLEKGKDEKIVATCKQNTNIKISEFGAVGVINYTLWSDVFLCSECGGEIVFWDLAVEKESYQVKSYFNCKHCFAALTKDKLERAWETKYDSSLEETVRLAKQVPSLISYIYNGKKYQKKPDAFDWYVLELTYEYIRQDWVPAIRLMEGKEARRNDVIGITHVHQFYSPRALLYLSKFRSRLKVITNAVNLTSTAQVASKLYRFRSQGGSLGAGGGPMSGTLYIPSLVKEIPVSKLFTEHLKKTCNMRNLVGITNGNIIGTGSTSYTIIPNNSVDYLFFDPPFGANLMYSELNFIWEAWIKVYTAISKEAIENKGHSKSLNDYRELMVCCFKEAYRVLKPGHWLTVEFSNSKAAVWNSIQGAIIEAGFLIANVSALDKKQGSFKAVTTPTAVKQDLVISAYKPNGGFEKRFVSESDNEGIWDFIRTHIGYLPIVKKQGNELVKIPERDSRILFDQVVAYFVRNLRDVPLSSKEFQEGLLERFAERDGMIFLPEQVAEYDKARMTSSQLRQLSIFVDDESSSIEWLRQLLNDKPQTYQDIHPKFINELSGYKKAELQLELSTLLEQNFLKFDGKRFVPPQIHSYLSSNFKELRNLSKENSALLHKAKDRWYVPNPEREEDLQKLRERALLKQFEEYKSHTGKKLKVVRMEALRCGFKKAWQEREYATIIQVAEKIPAQLLQEDQKLLMWYDQAQTRHSDSSLF